MYDYQHGLRGYGDDTDTNTVPRQVFLVELEAYNPTLLAHNWKGVEMRAMLYNLSNEYATNTTVWIKKYEKYEWDVTQRGQFPFDIWTWIKDLVALYKEWVYQC